MYKNQNNGRDQYREVNVNTADRGHLLIMLYDGCLNFLNLTREGFESNDLQKAAKYIQKSQAIISELLNTLDHNQGGDISKKLSSLYEFMLNYLTEANMEKSAAKVTRVHDMLNVVANGFKEIVTHGLANQNSDNLSSNDDSVIIGGKFTNTCC